MECLSFIEWCRVVWVLVALIPPFILTKVMPR